jgi:hypothetical protein
MKLDFTPHYVQTATTILGNNLLLFNAKQAFHTYQLVFKSLKL